jgi:hypothetical protein
MLRSRLELETGSPNRTEKRYEHKMIDNFSLSFVTKYDIIETLSLEC